MGAAESASLRDVAPLNAALPGSSGGERPCAAQLCFGTARFIWQQPLSSGTANVSWRGRGPRHPGLALPKIIGLGRAFAAERWHCQRLLVWNAHAPPGIGTARESWRPVPPPFTPHSANCNAACANCNASSLVPPVKWPHKRYEPNRKEHPHVHRTLHRVLHRHDPRHCLCLPLHPCSAGKVSPLSSPDNLFLSHTPFLRRPRFGGF